MALKLLLIFTGSSLAGCLAVGVYRYLALRQNWFDVPNARSSHSQPIPGGGGIALAVVLLVGFIIATKSTLLTEQMSAVGALVSLTVVLALLGWWDDRFGLPRVLRAAVFLAAAGLLVAGTTPATGLLAAAWLLFLFAFINVFNFMDGTDGIAASQCLFFFLALAVLMAQLNPHHDLLYAACFVAGLASGFLFWNWSPARVFLGDAGSLSIGLLMAGMAMLAHVNNLVHISVSLILLAVFIAESLTVIILRLLNGERITDAHRTHVYQLLALHWRSHAKVALAYLLVNSAVLLPMAYLAQHKPDQSAIILACSYILLSLVAIGLRSWLLKASSHSR